MTDEAETPYTEEMLRALLSVRPRVLAVDVGPDFTDWGPPREPRQQRRARERALRKLERRMAKRGPA